MLSFEILMMLKAFAELALTEAESAKGALLRKQPHK